LLDGSELELNATLGAILSEVLADVCVFKSMGCSKQDLRGVVCAVLENGMSLTSASFAAALDTVETIKIDIFGIEARRSHLLQFLANGSDTVCELESEAVRGNIAAHDSSHL
tara:strand:+ start:146 stop:481 length:336 start_codon:yes stop_codon:yes gene_type:complete